MKQHVGSAAVFWGVIFLLCGVAIFCAVKHENKKVPWRVWDTSEQVCRVGGAIIALLGLGCFVCFFMSGCGGSQPEVIGIGRRNSVDAEQIGSLLTVAGVGAYFVFAILWARKSMKCRWLQRLTTWSFLALLAGLATLLVSFNVGCGARLPGPTDPVTVEVTVCDATLGGTAGQYYRLSAWRQAEGVCDEMLESSEARQQEIREATERDVADLNRELDAYLASHRTDCYNGPVFNDLQRLVEEKRRNGTLCRSP